MKHSTIMKYVAVATTTAGLAGVTTGSVTTMAVGALCTVVATTAMAILVTEGK